MRSIAAIIVDRNSEEPVYVQIARQIRAGIVVGELLPGDVLPAVRIVASDLGVNLNTVARAYRILEEDGFVVIRDRSGAVVAAPADRAEGAAIAKLLQELALVLARMRQAGLGPDQLRRSIDRMLEEMDRKTFQE